MKTVIDCDSVFEILTRAPFPTGSENDAAVEAHLCVCHECRHLAEALRPAVGLFHEALEHDESLPEYQGILARGISAGLQGKRQLIHVGPLIAACVAACLVVWFLQSATSRNQSPQSASQQPASPDGFAMLSALSLPRPCFSITDIKSNPSFAIEVATKPLATAGEVRFVCCSDCHRRGGNGPASARVMKAFQTACVACHEPAKGEELRAQS